MKPSVAATGGWLLMLSVLLSLIAQITGLFSGYWAGIPIWLVVMLFVPYVKPTQRKQIILLMAVGSIGLLYGVFKGLDGRYLLKALDANQNVVAMIVGVGFLRIFAVNSVKTGETLPQGKSAVIRTLLGAHLFGTVLNISSVMIIGDKLATQSKLSTTQGLVLLRGFAACAFWSPFFASMGLALTSAPGSELGTLVSYGIPVCAVALAISGWQLVRRADADSVSGYPISIYSLWMPALLASVVIAAHKFYPHISVLSLVTLTSLCFIALWLLINKGYHAIVAARNHIESGIANSSGEVVLFAAAAMLASGVAASLDAMNIQLAPQHFGPIEASVTVAVLIALAMTGMHPVTSVVLAGSVLAPSMADPNMLGLTLLMGWSLGITASPFSGVQLSIQSRYDISAKALLKANWRYITIMYLVCCSVLWWYSTQI
ncbi:hypothetical protein ACF8PD_02820 [Vibrio plantisponsor]|uniref:hypothetical protein n=1 Tax=Vibrio plantisponsor TaxID=664643 RepID=UPI00370C72F9